MRFLIYGAGALGQALGCLLGVDGHQVDFLLRKRFISNILQSGLHVAGILGDFSLKLNSDDLHENLADVSDRYYNYVLLTTKAYDTKKAVEDLATIGHRFSHIVSLQNGCGNVEILKERFGHEKTLGGRVITGFEIIAPGQVNITVSADAIHIGSSTRGLKPESVRKLAAAISKAGHQCRAVEDIYQSLFSKLLYNCTLNPLGAILGVHYGLLADQNDTRQLMKNVIDETYSVISALGGKTAWLDSASYKREFFDKLIPATYHHRPSMLQDLENGKPTEIDALTGYVSMKGQSLGIATPTCNLLTSLVKFKEYSS